MPDNDRDWVKSDIDWSYKAWMSHKDADLCEQILLSVANSCHGQCEILEWGSGRSTDYFTKFLASKNLHFRWLSVEYDRKFFSSLNLSANTQNSINTTIHFSTPDNKIPVITSPNDSPFKLEYVVFNYGLLRPMLAAQKADRKVKMDTYVQFPGTLGRKFDFVLVDGRHRRDCLLHVCSWLADTGIVILHDAYRPYYHCSFKSYPVSSFLGDILWVGANNPSGSYWNLIK